MKMNATTVLNAFEKKRQSVSNLILLLKFQKVGFLAGQENALYCYKQNKAEILVLNDKVVTVLLTLLLRGKWLYCMKSS